MDEKSFKTDLLLRYLRGELTGPGLHRIEEELKRSPELRAERRLLEALNGACDPTFTDAEWTRIEGKILGEWNAGRRERTFRLPPSRPAWGLVAAAAVFLLLAGVAYLLRAPAPSPIPEGPNQAIPRFTAELLLGTGAVELEALGEMERRGTTQFSLAPGDRLRTGENGLLGFRLEGRAALYLTPESELVVEEEADHLLLRLARGTLFLDVAHDPARPLNILLDDALVRDVGTTFACQRNGSDSRVAVLEGEVAILPKGDPTSALNLNAREGARSGDQGRSWTPDLAGTGELLDWLSRTFPQKTAAPGPAGKEEKSPSAPSSPPATRPSETPLPKAPHRERVSAEGTPLPVSWQRTLEGMSDPERKGVTDFYARVEEQMAQGRSALAAQNLQSFIADHPGPENEKALFLLGECWASLGESSKALEAHRRYLETYPEGTWTEVSQARLYEILHPR